MFKDSDELLKFIREEEENSCPKAPPLANHSPMETNEPQNQQPQAIYPNQSNYLPQFAVHGNCCPIDRYTENPVYQPPPPYLSYIDVLAEHNRTATIIKEAKKNKDEQKIRDKAARSSSWLNNINIPCVPHFAPQLAENLHFPLPPILGPLTVQTQLSNVSALLTWCVIAAIATGNKVEIQCDPFWREVTSILTAVSIHSGARKSVLAERARKAIIAFLKGKNKTAMIDKAQIKIVDKILKKFEKDAVNRGFEELSLRKSKQERREFLQSFAQTSSEEIDLLPEEYAILIDTFTRVGLLKHLKSYAEQAGIITAEADAFNSLFFDKNNDPSFFNKLHNQEPYTYTTAYKNYAFTNPTLSMLALIQPNIAKKLYSNENLRETGASARILPYFDPMMGHNYFEANDSHDEELLTEKILKILNCYHGSKSNIKYTATLTGAAYRLVKEFENELKQCIIPNTHIRAHATLRKLHGYAVRFAWAIHLLYNEGFHEIPIGIQSMEMAIDLCRVLIPHIEYAYDPAGLQSEENAIKIIEFFRNINLKIDTLEYGYTDSRTIQQHIHRNAKEVEDALTMLKRLGYVDVINVGRVKNIVVPHPRLLGSQQSNTDAFYDF